MLTSVSTGGVPAGGVPVAVAVLVYWPSAMVGWHAEAVLRAGMLHL